MKTVRVAILVAIVLALVGTQSVWAYGPNGGGKRVHAVRRGDIPYRIARVRGNTFNARVRCIDACNRNCTYKGQRLVAPCKKIPARACRAVYTVRRGDTLQSIARQYCTTVQAIMNRNRIRNRNRIYAGQRLCVPQSPYWCGECSDP
jgi:spore germination protein YaaH